MLFEHQVHLKERDLHRYAGEVGLDLARYTAEMDDHIYLQRSENIPKAAAAATSAPHPTFFLDGAVQDISFGMQALHDAVAAAVHRGG